MDSARGRATDSRRPSPLKRIGGLVSRRPRAILGVWLAIVVALAAQGIGLEGNLSPAETSLEGTPSHRAKEIAERHFGNEDSLVIMLRGPRVALERQGRQLERKLDALPGTSVVAPWRANGAIDGLRPSPDVAALLVNVGHASDRASVTIVPPVRELVDETIKDPVSSDIAGTPIVVRSLREAARSAVRAGERIAIPAMLLVLLLVFRSVIAAIVPVLVGGAVVAASRGVFDLLARVMGLEAFAVGVLAMMGLALGVDYALLVISRFREERDKGLEVAEAVQTTVATTGRAVVSAGTGLALTMLVAVPLLPGPVVTSIATAVIVASTLSVLSALFVVPAVLVLLGPNIERWSLPQRSASQGLAGLSRRLTRRPLLVTVPVVLLLLLGSGYAFALDTGIATAGLLPPKNEGHVQQQAVERTLGPGWGAPFEIVMDGGARPVTTPDRLRALAAFERRVKRDPGVAAMAGLSKIERGTRQIADLEQMLDAQDRRLSRLDRGLRSAHDGSSELTEGLGKATAGAGALHSASGETRRGADRLGGGLRDASGGAQQLVGGLGSASAGSDRLTRGAQDAQTGAGRLEDGLDRAHARTGGISNNARVLRDDLRTGDGQLTALKQPLDDTEAQLDAAWKALQRMTVGRGDPQFDATLQAIDAATRALTGVDPSTGEQVDSGYEGVAAGVTDAKGQFSLGLYLANRMEKDGAKSSRGIARLARGADRLDRGVRRVAEGSVQVSEGLQELQSSGADLPPGLERLSNGADLLAGGIGEVEAGAGQLNTGVGRAAAGSGELEDGLQRLQASVARQRSDSPAGVQEASPGLFRSGYLYLASLDGAEAEKRSQAGRAISVDRGGLAARMLVIPKEGPLSEDTVAVRERLQGYADDLATTTASEVAVGGPVANLLDYDDAVRDGIPLAILLLSFVTVVTLVPVIRSLTLPLVSALLNVITVGAALGALALLFDNSLLGGPGYVDTASVVALIMVMFGLATDYEIFVLARMREEYERTGSSEEAIVNGLARTARLVAGAAAIMITVFLAFSFSPFPSLRNFGVGQAIAVFIDAFLIRIVVLPAVMRLLGDWCWWMPAWLDRLLPRMEVEPTRTPAGDHG
jgi:RND superfamily putative drug exporter